MDYESPTAHRAKPRRWLIGLVLALVTLLASPFLLLWYGSWSAGRRVEEQLRAIRAKNQPVTPEELNEFYAAPAPDSDVTQVILDALQLLNTPAFDLAAQPLPIVGRSKAPIPPPGQTWGDLEAVEKFLGQFAASLKNFHQASRKNGSTRYPVDFHQGFAVTLPHIQNLRSGVRMLALETHVRAHQGDARGAAESIQALFSLAKSLENEPIPVSQLLRVAIRRVAYMLIVELLPHVDFVDDDLEAIQLAVRSCDYREGIFRALLGVRVIDMEDIRNPVRVGFSIGPTEQAGMFAFGNEDLSFFLDLITSTIDTIERSWTDARDAVTGIDTRIRESAASKSERLRHVWTLLMLPDVGQMVHAGMRGEANQQAVAIAIAIERFRRTRERLPENLDALVPEFLEMVPLDPFDDRPMRFKSADGVILIYSIGADGIDNGGLDAAGKGEPDIVIRIGKPSLVLPEPPE